VTVVTATTGRPELMKCIDSVARQDHPNVQHLIIVDGPAFAYKAETVLQEAHALGYHPDVINLPYSVGSNRYNGHRMYAAATYLAEGDHIAYLDDDNWIDTNHISSLYAIMTDVSVVRPQYAYSMRKIVSEAGDFIVNDDCESLGPKYGTCIDINDHLIDVNCYFFQKDLAIQMSPIWNRQARPVRGREVDRELVFVLRELKVAYKASNLYTVNYRMGGNALSVQAGFFKAGNDIMLKRFGGQLPWQQAK
jgi:glycosyltransferase involved in cell wall biosynthesis